MKTNRIITKPDNGIAPIYLFYPVFNLTNNKGLETLIKKTNKIKQTKIVIISPNPIKIKPLLLLTLNGVTVLFNILEKLRSDSV